MITACSGDSTTRPDGRVPVDTRVVDTITGTAGTTVQPSTGLITSEAGGTATFTVVLDRQPTADVQIPLTTSDATEGTVDPAMLTFTPANWNAPQTVTVTGVDDNLQDGDQAYTAVLGPATSDDDLYQGHDADDVGASNTDNDSAGITVTPTTGLQTQESGQTDTFTIVLNSQPTANVTIGLSSSDTTEGIVAPSSVTFTTANWDAPQTVTVTGVNDALQDGTIAYSIRTAAATSTDASYDGIDPPDVAVENADNDTAGITVTPTSGLVTSEAGETATFTVRLNTQPTASVTIGLSSSDTTEGSVSPVTLTFTTSDWNAPQMVTVTGLDDAAADGAQPYSIITAPAVSTDPNYSGRNGADVAVSNQDNDTPRIVVTPTTGLVTRENAPDHTATFTVRLVTQPSANVTIAVSSSDVPEGTPSPAMLTFTPANWNTPQTVTVTGADDDVADGNQPYTIVTAAASSADAGYNGLNPPDVAVTNIDDETPGFTVSPQLGLRTTEPGGTATFRVRLNSQPSANVTIGLSSSDTTEGVVSPGQLVFTAATWSDYQTVTVTGVDDTASDGDQVYVIVTAAATSADVGYANLNPPDVQATNADNDLFIVTPTTGLTTTEAGGTATFTVRLGKQPSGNVSFTLASNDATEGTVSPTTLTFTSTSWNMAQTVTVTGVNDNLDDGNIAFAIVTAAATSSDPSYAGLNPPDVAVSNTDDDTAGITVNPTTGLTTSEVGGTATFTVRLNSQPTADVTIGLTSSNTAEGLVSPASVTFTGANWNMPRTVTVTGQDDMIDDGNVAYTINTAAAVSADPNYDGLNAANVSVTNTDNDTAGFTIAISPAPCGVGTTTTLETSESLVSDCFSMRLTAQPTANVTVSLSSSDPTEGAVVQTSLTFTAQNWNAPQTVQVTGVDDALPDGAVSYSVVTASAVSADASYNNLNPPDVPAVNADND